MYYVILYIERRQ